MKIYVGNLSYEVTEEGLRQEFEAFGGVTSVSIITDKYSGRPKGFGFVEMASVSEGQALVLMTEVAGPMVTEGVADSVEEDREDTKLTLHYF